MVEGMAGSKSQQTQINDGSTLSAQGTEQPDLPEGLTTWQNTCQTSLSGLLIQNRFCLWALRVCYYKHMLQCPCVTNSSASPWMAPTQNIKHTACNPSQCGQKFSALVNFNFFFFFYGNTEDKQCEGASIHKPWEWNSRQGTGYQTSIFPSASPLIICHIAFYIKTLLLLLDMLNGYLKWAIKSSENRYFLRNKLCGTKGTPEQDISFCFAHQFTVETESLELSKKPVAAMFDS